MNSSANLIEKPKIGDDPISTNDLLSNLYKQIESLKSNILMKDHEHEQELETLKEKQKQLLIKRDSEIKLYTNSLSNQLKESKSEQYVLKNEIRLLSEANEKLKNQLKEKILLKDNKNKETLEIIILKQELKAKQIENKYKNLFDSLITNTLSNNGDEYNNKIKVLYEELFYKDKQILNLEQENLVLKENLSNNEDKLVYEKENILNKINDLENNQQNNFPEQLKLMAIENELSLYKQNFEEKLEELSNDYEKLIKEIKLENDEITSTNTSLKNNNFALENEKNNLIKENSILKDKIDSLNTKYLEYFNTFDDISLINKQLSSENSILKNNLSNLNLNIGRFVNSKMDELDIRKDIEKKYQEKIDQLNSFIFRLENENKELKIENRTKAEDYDKSIKEAQVFQQ